MKKILVLALTLLFLTSCASEKSERELCESMLSSVVEMTTATSSASATVVGKDGEGYFLVTNYHALFDTGALTEKITLSHDSSEEGYDAECIWQSTEYDLALLYSRALFEAFPHLSIVFEGDEAFAGMSVYSVSNAEGDGTVISKGTLTRLRDEVYLPVGVDAPATRLSLMRTDALVASGSSGGALFDERGAFVGLINSRRLDTSEGFALPASTVFKIIKPVLDGGDAYRLDLGASLEGSRVTSARNGSIASTFLSEGDELLEIRVAKEKTKIKDENTVDEALLGLSEGDEITVLYISGGKEKTFSFTAEKNLVRKIK